MNSDYPIQFQNDAFADLLALLRTRAYSKVFVLVDSNTFTHCWPLLQAQMQPFRPQLIQIKAGEAYKNIDTCQYIWQQLLAGQADRKAVLLNLGGGVIGDMGGFCASTFKRGMDFIQIPTTLLAQVDASIGGKLGIDFEQVKNGIGLFRNPRAVFLHTPFFDTLPPEQLLSGFAEVLKHALIADAEYWQQLTAIEELSNADWAAIIPTSLHIKQRIVAQDPQEKGLRKSLNFGHTIGHAIESLSWQSNQPLLHGHAVAIGMLTEAYLSHKKLELPADTLALIAQVIVQHYSYYDCQIFSKEDICQLILQDKKNENQQVNFTLLNSLGQCEINQQIPLEWVDESLAYYQTLYR